MKGGTHGSMPPEVQEELERGAPETRRKIEQVWHLLGRLEDDPPAVSTGDDAWVDLEQRLEAPAPAQRARDRAPHRHRARRSARGRRLGLTIAGGLALLLLGVWLWQQPAQVVAERGDQRIVTLPDGSTAHLNSESRLTYRRGFQAWPFISADRRVVMLEGEAFFDVVPGARPFVVETFNARVEVLGTEFDVRARRGPWEGETRVILASGRVRVSAQHDPEYAVMLTEAGQMARIGQTTAVPDASSLQQAQMNRLLIWRRNGFSVVDKPLPFILAKIERRFAVSIDIEEGLALTDSMTLFYPRGATAEKIINDICLLRQCRYRQTSSGFTMFPADL